MEDVLKRTNRWNSLPPVLSHIHVTSSSFLRDDSCASDDISDISTVTTATTVTNVSSTVPEFGIPIPHTPKQHFHLQSFASHGFDGYESGYEPDDSEIEGTEHVEFSDHVRQYLDVQFQDDEDIFDFEVYPSVAMDDEIDAEMALYNPFEHESDLEESDFDMDSAVEDPESDDEHVAFGNSVRFDTTNISYIEPPKNDDDTEDDEPEVTMHELMLLARKDRESAGEGIADSDSDGDSEVDESHDDDSETAIADLNILQLSRDYSRDMIDIDKQIFVAFINGIHEATKQKYQSHLHDRVQGFREGEFQSPFFESDDDSSSYLFLDDALKHVIGMFRLVVSRGEFEELGRLAGSRNSGESESESTALFERIEHLVSERLLEGRAVVGENELSFFADGVVYALERPQIYAYDVPAAST